MRIIFNIILITLCISILNATEITFTFSNGQITGSDPTFYEFDILVHADESDTRLGDTQVYINYNALGFGNNIAGMEKIQVTKGQLLSGDLIPGLPLYDIVNVVDNSSSKVAIAAGYNYDGSPESANLLPTSPTTLLHIKIEIADSMQNAGLSFDEALMTGVQYKSDNSAKYEPVVAEDQDDSPLRRFPSYIEYTKIDNYPVIFELHQNYPNPFNPSTKIVFGIPNHTAITQVKINIYDVSGKKVKTLFDGTKAPGEYQIEWDGTDDSLQAVASGVYVYRLITDSHVFSRIMVLVR